MTKPAKTTWAFGDPSYIIEPDAGQKNTGWLAGQKPPFQTFNWLHYNYNLWEDYFEARIENNAPTTLISTGSATWNGSTLTLSQPLDISFRVTTGEQINRLAAAGYALSNGQVLVFRKNKTGSSPVSLTNGSYGTLDNGQYVIVNESSLTAVGHEYETIVFRRRGSNLEDVINGLIYESGSTIYFGMANHLRHYGDLYIDNGGDLYLDSNSQLFFDEGTNDVYCRYNTTIGAFEIVSNELTYQQFLTTTGPQTARLIGSDVDGIAYYVQNENPGGYAQIGVSNGSLNEGWHWRINSSGNFQLMYFDGSVYNSQWVVSSASGDLALPSLTINGNSFKTTKFTGNGNTGATTTINTNILESKVWGVTVRLRVGGSGTATFDFYNSSQTDGGNYIITVPNPGVGNQYVYEYLVIHEA